jgi:hypothetical protein
VFSGKGWHHDIYPLLFGFCARQCPSLAGVRGGKSADQISRFARRDAIIKSGMEPITDTN